MLVVIITVCSILTSKTMIIAKDEAVYWQYLNSVG